MRNSGIYFFLLVAGVLLFIAACSHRAQPGISDRDRSSGATVRIPQATFRLPDVSISASERRRLELFMEEGIEQPVAVGKATPAAVIETARGYLGVPHCMGGTTTRCMDCSGLVFRAFGTNGITLPHSSEEQARYGRIIADREMLMPGDLVFFVQTYNTSRLITHSGIFIGEGMFIHTSSRQGVTITPLDDPYWKERYLFGTRVFE
ncbi:MAG: C40 family peptidase [Bacteroidales bacterium]|nr:C40 family peptidase [Bacteroidales bacterium]